MNFIFLKITLRSAVTNKKPILTAKKTNTPEMLEGTFTCILIITINYLL
jgi:hypothetical protein